MASLSKEIASVGKLEEAQRRIDGGLNPIHQPEVGHSGSNLIEILFEISRDMEKEDIEFTVEVGKEEIE